MEHSPPLRVGHCPGCSAELRSPYPLVCRVYSPRLVASVAEAHTGHISMRESIACSERERKYKSKTVRLRENTDRPARGQAPRESDRATLWWNTDM